MTAHQVNDDCLCSHCGKTVHGVKEGAYCRHDDYVYLGSYPQTEVTDSEITATLNQLAGTLPTAEDAQKWTDYGYYQADEKNNPIQTSYMWYIDLELDGAKYRGVYFTSYRLYSTQGRYFNDGDTYQDDHGYIKGNVYWFAFEPIKWRILTTDDDGIAMLLCEKAIDSQNIYISGVNMATRMIDGKKVWDNNYQYSTIRTWLNETFYNTAFNDLEKEIIQLTTVDNSARSTNPDNNPKEFDSGNNVRACPDTQDYVYLPSEQEVTTEAYGFNPSYRYDDPVRQKEATDYTKSQGCYTEVNWWLRSPECYYTENTKRVSADGKTYRYSSVDISDNCVVPVVRIAL